MAYLLDSDVFIRAKNDHFGFDFCPAFWDWLVLAHYEDTVASVEAVYRELMELFAFEVGVGVVGCPRSVGRDPPESRPVRFA